VGAYLGYRIWFGWSRWTILLFFLMVVLAYCWQKRVRWLPVWSVIAAVPILVIFNTLGHNRDFLKAYFERRPVQALEYIPGLAREEKARRRLDTQDFANFDYLTYVVDVVPKRTGTYTYGLQYLQLFTEPIPRILWRGKPFGAPVKLISIGNYGNFTGLTVSLVGDGWISGGWIGLLITLSLAGALLGRAHRWFWNQQHSVIFALLYISGLAMIPQWYRDGGISISKFLLFTWLPFGLWLGLSWCLGNRRVPGSSTVVTGSSQLRILYPEKSAATGFVN
jgi:hypothetical protein